jgi:hypothetical protein
MTDKSRQLSPKTKALSHSYYNPQEPRQRPPLLWRGPTVSQPVLSLTRIRNKFKKANSVYMVTALSDQRIWNILVEEHTSLLSSKAVTLSSLSFSKIRGGARLSC